MAKQRRDIAQEITDKFIAIIEAGKVEGSWQRGWEMVGGELPTNIESGNVYRGMNFMLLAMMGGGEWGTYKQWQTKGHQVKKGEKGVGIIRPLFGKDKVTGDDKLFGWAAATVFNGHQVEGYEFPTIEETDKTFDNNEVAEAIVKANDVDVRHGGNKAFYVPSADFVQMPTKEQFHNESEYYSTLLHEVVHWTGHKTRMDRDLNTARFGNEAYAFEELVAELGACFLSAHTGVHVGFNENHAKYIDGWLKIMKGDKNAVITASSKAQAAVDMLLDNAEKKEVVVDEAA